jgi:hypothetical protein
LAAAAAAAATTKGDLKGAATKNHSAKRPAPGASSNKSTSNWKRVKKSM